MFKNVWLKTGLLMLLVLAVNAPQSFALNDQVVFIDLDRVFNEFYKTKIADAQLKEKADEFNGERKKLVGKFEVMQEEFTGLRDDAQSTAYSEEVRTEKRNSAEERLIELRDHESKIRRFDETRKKQLKDQGARMRKRLVDEIGEAVETYARNQGFSAVIDSSGQSLNGLAMILYSDPKSDITDDVVDLLNKGKN